VVKHRAVSSLGVAERDIRSLDVELDMCSDDSAQEQLNDDSALLTWRHERVCVDLRFRVVRICEAE